MKDSLLLEKMFEMSRWEKLIDRAYEKHIDIALLTKMCEPQTRLRLYHAIKAELIEFAPPHMAQIPKDTPGEFRTVFVGEGVDRIIQSIINDCLFDIFTDMVHPSCKSYQVGLGTGKTVKELSSKIVPGHHIIGIKSDFSKYFDTVNISSIMDVFDRMEDRLGFEHGTEPVINLLRKTWMNNIVFDLDGNLIEQYCGIRQGNAVGSFLADAILYELDDFMSKKYPFYCRYSDDCVTIGDDPDEIVSDMNRIIVKYGVSLNPRKVEVLYGNEWFKFLGFNLCGKQISFSRKAIKNLQTEIDERTKDCSAKTAVRKLMRYLYQGEYNWATRFLPIVNVDADIQTLNAYIMDSIRSCETGKKKIGGLGENRNQKDGCVQRGTGKNVTANRKRWCETHGTEQIASYLTLMTMRNALREGRAVYEALLASVR